MRLLRLAKIVRVALKYGLDEYLTDHERFRAVRPLARAVMRVGVGLRLRIQSDRANPRQRSTFECRAGFQRDRLLS